MIKHLSSTKNQLVKDLLCLQEKSAFRKERKQFVVEGIREVKMALSSGYELEYLLFDPSVIRQEKLFEHFKLPENKVISIASNVCKKLAYRNSTEGLIALMHSKNHRLNDLKLSVNPLILVMEAVEKPGNVGAMLRTADAAGVDAVIIANPVSDLYNPNIVRASLGCLFSMPIAVGATNEVTDFLKSKKIISYAASLKSSTNYTSVDYRKPTAVVVGSESKGLSLELEEACTKKVIIPMRGKVDSMNVSVSAAILLFEAVRVRSLNFL